MKQRFYVFVECEVGRAYEAGRFIATQKKDFVSSTSSTSGEWDLLLLVEIDAERDVGKLVAELFKDVPHILNTNTVAAYRILGV